MRGQKRTLDPDRGDRRERIFTSLFVAGGLLTTMEQMLIHDLVALQRNVRQGVNDLAFWTAVMLISYVCIRLAYEHAPCKHLVLKSIRIEYGAGEQTEEQKSCLKSGECCKPRLGKSGQQGR